MMLQLTKYSNGLNKTGGVSHPAVARVDVRASDHRSQIKPNKEKVMFPPKLVYKSSLSVKYVMTTLVKRACAAIDAHGLGHPSVEDGVKCLRLIKDPGESGREMAQRSRLAEMELSTQRATIKAFMDAQGIQYITMGDSGGITTITGSAGGVIANVFVLDFSVSTNSASLANLFDEYRMHSARVDYVPLGLYVSSTVAGVINPVGDGVSVVDLDSASALASYVAAVAFDSRKRFSIVEKNKQSGLRKASLIDLGYLRPSQLRMLGVSIILPVWVFH